MAQNINYGSEIKNGDTIKSEHVSQFVDAFTAVEAYNIDISGSLNIVGTTSGSFIGDGSGLTGLPSGETYIDTEFTSAQLLDLINTPVELIPAQGAGTIVFIDKMITKYTFGTTAYSQQGNSSLKIYYSYGITGLPSAADNMAAIDTAQDYYELHNNTINSAGTPTELENTAISSIVLNPITLGDGTIKIRTYYSIIPSTF